MEPTMKVVKQEAVRQLQYVTALLEVLHGGGRLDADQLEAAKQQLALSYRQVAESHGKSQLIAAMAIDPASTIGPLVTIFAPQHNRQKNLLRLCLLDYLPRYREAITLIATQLLSKAKLTINRPLFGASASDRRGDAEKKATVTLAGTQLLNVGSELAKAAEAITARHQDLSRYAVPESCFFEPFSGFHFKLSRSLGFEGMVHETDDLVFEQRSWQRFTTELAGLMSALLPFLQLAAPLIPGEALSEARRAVKGLKALLAQDIRAFTSDARSEEDIYVQRVALSQLLSHGLDQLAQLAVATKGFFRAQVPEDHLHPPAAFLWQPFAQYLFSKGVAAQDALSCVSKLKSYCEKNQTHPKDLSVEELRFVADAFKPAYQEFFQISTDGFLHAKNQDSSQKEAIMTRSQKLVQALGRSGAVAAAAMLALFPLLFAGCGVKTAPRAAIDNLRPTIPFKAKPVAKKPAKKAPTSKAAKE